MSWSQDDIPDLRGKTALVTGANSGIGFASALELTRRGALVVLGCRDASKGDGALERIRAAAPGSSVELLPLDLARLAAVREAAASFLARHVRLDLLINNAGVMALPFRTTEDGFELQIGTNHLGHFALTGLLLEALLAAPAPRVVTVSSLMHRPGVIRFDDLFFRRGYRKWPAYCQSKLANLLFAYELDRRARRRGAGLASLACHPGYTATNLLAAGPSMAGSRALVALTGIANRLFGQRAENGALPTLFAATAADVEGGDFIGPGGFLELAGPPAKVRSNDRSHNLEDATRLWLVSEELTGVRYAALEP